jgi:putative nucleotidyltransferase with HDIG domain
LGELQDVLRKFQSIFRAARKSAFAPLVLYAAGLVVTALGGLFALIQADFVAVEPLWLVAALACLAYVAERNPVRISPNAEVTASVLPMLFGAVLFGPLVAMVVAAMGLLAELRAPYMRWVIWTASRSLAAGAAGLAALITRTDNESFGWLVASVVAATAAAVLVDTTANAFTVKLRGTGTFSGFVRSATPLLLTEVPFYSAAVALLMVAYEDVSTWSVVLFLGPAFAAHKFYRLYHEERKATAELKSAYDRLERASLSFASGLVAALDARDRYTAGHSAAVAVYARDIAVQLQLSDHEQQLAHLSGLLHDIGKVGLPPGILEKEGPLTADERRQMEEHSAIGERILANVHDYEEIASIVRHHHERVDGTGYPDGVSGDEIPVLARVIAVADAYNAMTSGRPYRAALTPRDALAQLASGSGTQFDPHVVAAFLEILSGSAEAYRRGARSDFALEAQRHRVLRTRPATAA